MTHFDEIRADVLRLLAAGPPVDFEEDGHVYTAADGERLPSVSQLAGGGEGYSIAERTMPEVLARGRMVADLISFLETHGYGKAVPSGLAGFMKSWLRFKRWCGWRTIASERPLIGHLSRCRQMCGWSDCAHAEVFRFAGKLDVLGWMDDPPECLPPGMLWVVELKTGGKPPASASRQAAGYLWQVGVHVGARYRVGAFALRLDGEGEMQFTRKRRKGDEKLVPACWGEAAALAHAYGKAKKEMPLLGDIRPASWQDLADFHAACWKTYDETRDVPIYFGAQGGDAIGRKNDNAPAVEDGGGPSLPLPSSPAQETLFEPTT
jgi:hypothetical protein